MHNRFSSTSGNTIDVCTGTHVASAGHQLKLPYVCGKQMLRISPAERVAFDVGSPCTATEGFCSHPCCAALCAQASFENHQDPRFHEVEYKRDKSSVHGTVFHKLKTCLRLSDPILAAVHEWRCWQVMILFQIALSEKLLLQARHPRLHANLSGSLPS